MVTFLPVVSWGYAMTVIACALAGLVAAAVYAWSADLVTFWPARVVLGLLVVMVPVAGVEPLGNLANLHWFMLMLIPWALLASPRTLPGLVVVTVATLAATLTEPTCLIFAPLAIWRFVTVRRSRTVVIAWAIGVTAQVVTTLVSPRPRNLAEQQWMSLILGYVRDVGMSMFTPNPRILGSTVTGLGWWIGIVWVLALFVLAAVAARWARLDVRVLLLALVLGSVVSWSAAFIANNMPDFYYSLMTADELAIRIPVRWATAASAMVPSVIPIATSVLVTRFPRCRSAGWGVLGLMSVVMLVNVPARSGHDVPPWSTQVEAGFANCRASGTPIQVLTATDDWGLGIPCSYVDL